MKLWIDDCRPALYTRSACPKCGGKVKWLYDEDGHAGYRCLECDEIISLNQIACKVEESYDPDDIYREGYMSDEDYLWCKEHCITDVRKKRIIL